MSNGHSPVIPKEKLSAYQRWELHSFDTANGDEPAVTNRVADIAARASADTENIRRIHQQAYDAGRADGLREVAQKKTNEALQLQSLLTDIERQSHEFNQCIAHDVLELALEVARQMVRQALIVHPELIVTLIHDAVARATVPVTAATIALHPADATLVRGQIGDELAAAGWRIIDDANVLRGGTMLQTSGIQIDATVDTRWQHLSAALGQNNDWLAL